MKKIISSLRNVYVSQDSSFAIGFLLCIFVLPKLLCSVTMVALGHGIPMWLSVLYRLLSLLVAFVALMISFYTKLNKENLKRILNAVSESGIWFIASYVILTSVLGTNIVGPFYLSMLTKPWVLVTVFMGSKVIGYILLGCSVYAFFLQLNDTRNELHGIKLLTCSLRHCAIWMLGIIVWIVAEFVDVFVTYGINLLNRNAIVSYAQYISVTVISAGVYYLFLKPIYGAICKSSAHAVEKYYSKCDLLDPIPIEKVNVEQVESIHTDQVSTIETVVEDKPVDIDIPNEMNTESKKEAENKALPVVVKKKTFHIPPIVYRLIPVVLVLTIVIIKLVTNPMRSNADSVLSSIAADASATSLYAMDSDYLGTAANLDKTTAHMKAWEGFAENNPALMEEAVRMNQSYIQPRLILAYYRASQGDYSLFEKGIYEFPSQASWHFGLLNAYSKANELTKEQKALKQESLLFLITENEYVDSTINPLNLSEQDMDKISKGMIVYEAYMTYYNEYKVHASVIRNNGITMDAVNLSLEYAEKYPDNMLLQQIAYRLGSGFTYDGASHYRQVVEAAKRYDSLFMNAYKASIQDDNTYVSEKSEIASVMIELGFYEDGINYLRDAQKTVDSVEFTKLLAICYQRNQEIETAINYSEEVLQKEPGDTMSIYNIAIGNLKLGKIDDSIEFANKLCQIIMDESEPAEDSILLYTWAQYVTLNDSQTDATYGVYDKLTDAQRKELDEQYLLKATLELLNQYLNQKATEEMLVTVRGLSKIKDGLPYLYFLEGNICYELEHYEEAELAYLKSVELFDNQPHVWYSLAVLYDKEGKYEDGIRICEKVLSLMPGTDHLNDQFGVAIHSEWLLDSMKSALGIK